ncbi:MAG: acetyl-CoA decarbonylase/synthase complex subunit gamma, partial [Endomicrobiia bacterium]
NIVEEILKMRKLSLIGIVKNKKDVEKFVSLAKINGVALIVGGETLDEIVEIINLIVQQYEYKELIINVPVKSYLQTVEYLTQIRRLAIKKNFRSLGYPTILLIEQKQQEELLAYATVGILKYGSVVVIDTVEPEIHLALVTLRLNIYTDPQKPTTVEPKLYKIGGETTDRSPLLITTNFSLTYYSVEPEILNSKIPCWLLIVDTDGLSVLTAWAAEKFTAERVVESIKKYNIEHIITHKKLIIPGYVGIMSEKLSNLLPGWEIIVGPKESSGIPKFLKSIWSFNN